MNHRVAFCVLLLSGIAAACGGGQPEATQPSNPPAASAAPSASAAPAPSASAAPVESAAPTASAAPSASAPSGPPGQPGPGEWDSWSHDQKLEYMKSTVMPKMGGLFHDFDAKKYAEPKCVLCHGAGVKDGSFKMPNPGLPKLELSEAGFKKMKAKHPAMVEFMMTKVEETTAQLLGEQPYDPATQKGFGCLGCHTKVADKGAKADKTTDKADKTTDKTDKTTDKTDKK